MGLFIFKRANKHSHQTFVHRIRLVFSANEPADSPAAVHCWTGKQTNKPFQSGSQSSSFTQNICSSKGSTSQQDCHQTLGENVPVCKPTHAPAVTCTHHYSTRQQFGSRRRCASLVHSPSYRNKTLFEDIPEGTCHVVCNPPAVQGYFE